MVTVANSKAQGAFHTPPDLADWVASEVLAHASAAGREIRSVLDPACGEGALLRAMRQFAEAPITLMGIDIAPVAAARCSAALGPNARVRVGDALHPDCEWADRAPDAVVLNPPWGGELSHVRHFYQQQGYTLATGQFDTVDLFVERALTVLEPGALLGLILPETVFYPEHQGLRRLLLEHTLLLVARLGEGIFEGVYCGTAVIVLQSGPASLDHQVECLQVSPSQKRRIRAGEMSFHDTKRRYSHHVPQHRFRQNAQVVFDVACEEADHDILTKFSAPPRLDWDEHLHLGRGIEIGKHGITVVCRKCAQHRPVAAGVGRLRCIRCGSPIPPDAPRNTIIFPDPGRGQNSMPLIVGEDVDRYSANPSRSIVLDVPGIRYKPIEHFSSKKLLIRKTGVGLRTAVDESGSATLQAVFYAQNRNLEQDWLLDYLQGILNSRPLLAWYLKWSGENQWRSHPYVTPKILRQLPVPDPCSDRASAALSRSIAQEARKVRNGLSEADHVVDDLVCRLYELHDEDISWVKMVLRSADSSLQYFAEMQGW